MTEALADLINNLDNFAKSGPKPSWKLSKLTQDSKLLAMSKKDEDNTSWHGLELTKLTKFQGQSPAAQATIFTVVVHKYIAHFLISLCKSQCGDNVTCKSKKYEVK